MMREQERLKRFSVTVMYNAVVNDLGTITNDKGQIALVACLDEEPLRVLVDRVAACGGYATVFSLRQDGLVRITEVVDDQCAIRDDTDLMIADEAPDPEAPIGLFLDYLATQETGVTIPNNLGSRVREATKPRTVKLEEDLLPA